MSGSTAENGTSYGLSWEFLDEIGWWALGIGLLLAVAGSLATGTAAFAVGCALGTISDVVIVRLSSRRAARELEAGRIDSAAPTAMVAGRLLVKALLLVLSLVAPSLLSFAGTVAGILVFDVTLAFVGGGLAIARTMSRPKEGG